MTRAYFIGRVLQHLGCDVEVVGHLPRGDTIYPRPPAGLPVSPVDGSFPGVIRSVSIRIDGDIAYAIKPLPTSFGAALLARQRRGTPIVLDIDDNELLLRSGRPKRRRGGGWLRRAVRGVRHLPRVVTNQRSRPWAWWMEKRLPRADAITTNNRALQEKFGGALLRGGKDTDLFDPSRFDDDDARRALGLDGNFVVMFPGTAREHKGLEDVLVAMDRLGDDRARLVIVGGREIGREYAEELARRWPQWVRVLPPRGVDDMPATLAAAHVVVVAQRDVGIARSQFPIKLTDAMAMARPIITTRVGDIPDIVGDTAWIVPASSPDDIASALREIVSDPLRAHRRGETARRRCIATLGMDSAAEVIGEVVARVRATAAP
jgi:glycosyltransferase involved in cell wall biosynthesis